jgi:hypothetical protein
MRLRHQGNQGKTDLARSTSEADRSATLHPTRDSTCLQQPRQNSKPRVPSPYLDEDLRIRLGRDLRMLP